MTMYRKVKGGTTPTLTAIVLAALILSGGVLVAPLSALAQEQEPAQVPVTIVDADGEMIITDPPPIIVENRTMVPIFTFAKALQAKVVWDADQRMVMVTKGRDVMRIRVDSDQAKISGQSLSFGVPACIVSDRVYVPLRSVAEALGEKVDWNDATRTVTLVPGSETKT